MVRSIGLTVGLVCFVACGGDDSSGGSEDETGADTGDTSDADDGTDGTDESGDTGFDGEPLPPVDEWTYLEIEGSQCRNGSPAGFSYRMGSSPNLMIFFMGGNACFNQPSCAITPLNVQLETPPEVGIAKRDEPANPVADWNQVFLPYCTGDIFGGSKPNSASPLIPGPQQFVGYDNMDLFLDRIVPTFQDAEKVLITGSSAGGFGAAYNFDRVQQAFGMEVEAILLDDAGPPMADTYLAPCLQAHWRDVWGLANTLPEGCPECTGDDGGGIVNYMAYLGNKYPDRRMGIISSLQDSTIRQFWAYGDNECEKLTSILPPAPFDETAFQAGLEDLRDTWMDGPQWGSYYTEGSQHTFLGSDDFYMREVGGVLLSDWVADLIDGSASHVAP